MIYYIYHENFEKFEKKIQTIKRKCEKYGNPFYYECLGTEYKKVSEYEFLTNSEKQMVKPDTVFKMIPVFFYKVQIYGTAKINNWEFVGTVYKTDKGNLIKKVIDIEIPEHYYYDEPICEHCKKNIKRKFTYIIHNIETGDFKSVGKACLRDYTNGLDAELVAQLENLIRVSEEFSDVHEFKPIKTFDIDYILRLTSEICRLNNGYNLGHAQGYQTHVTVKNMYYTLQNGYDNALSKMYSKLDLNSKETDEIVKKCYEYAKNSDDLNLKIAFECKNAPLSFIEEISKVIFNFYPELVDNNDIYEYYGKVGDKFKVTAKLKFVTSFNRGFGLTNLYKFTFDKYCFTWFSDKDINDGDYEISGIIKSHNEYLGKKETLVTKCKIENRRS